VAAVTQGTVVAATMVAVLAARIQVQIRGRTQEVADFNFRDNGDSLTKLRMQLC
jgi:hypothetical protein